MEAIRISWGATAGLVLLMAACSGDPDAASSDPPPGGGVAASGESPVPGAGEPGDAAANGAEPANGASETAPPGAPAEPPGNPTAPPGSRIACADPIAVEPISPPGPAGCLTSVAAGDHTFPCQGLDFLLRVPERCTEYACGLIVDVHGGTMSAAQMRKVTELDRLAPPCDYIVLHPNNSSPIIPGIQETSRWEPYNDPTIKEFIDTVIQAFSVDRGRIHFTGFSLGGNMTWRFACKHGELFTSVAPIAAVDRCVASLDPEMPILFMHGYTDVVVSFESAEQMRDRIVSALHMGDPDVIDNGDAHTRTRYTNGRGTVFDFLEHAFGGQPVLDGHCVPGGIDVDSGPFSTTCTTPPDIEHVHWGEVALDFFLEMEGR